MPILGIIASSASKYPSRSLGTFTTSSTGNPNPAWEYYQGIGASFPSANVTVSVGLYEPYYTTGATYTIANGGGGWTTRTSYPTSIFQTMGIANDGKFFILGGNGLNGTPGGGTTAATYYMTTALSGWTAGTTLPSSGGWGGGNTKNRIYVSQNSSTAYTGTGTGTWSSCAVATGVGPFCMNVGNAFSFSTSTTYSSDNDAVSWTDTGIAPPLSTSPTVVGPTDNNAATSIYLFYNTYSTPAGYYFNGNAYVSTNNYGTETVPTGSGTGNSQFGSGINGNQITFLFGNGGYRYATINA